MRIDVFVHQVEDPNPKLDQIIKLLTQQGVTVMATQVQVAALQDAENAEQQAVQDEITRVNDGFAALEQQLANAGTTDPAIDAVIAQLKDNTSRLAAVAVNTTPPATPVPVPPPAT